VATVNTDIQHDYRMSSYLLQINYAINNFNNIRWQRRRKPVKLLDTLSKYSNTR